MASDSTDPVVPPVVPPGFSRRDFMLFSAAAAALALGGCQTESVGAAPDAELVAGLGAQPRPTRTALPGYGISDEAYAAARARATALVKRMTLAEKISQTGSSTPAINRLKIPAYNYYAHEGLHGVTNGGPITSFPQPVSMGQSWNPVLVQKAYDVVSTEARAIYNENGTPCTFFSPTTVNMGGRDPRWGRLEENFSEDPLLVETFGVAAIRGMQGNNKTYLKSIACAKHYICNDTDTDREQTDANPDKRSFWEYYTRGFHACVVDGKAFTVMSSYNSVWGIPTSANPFLLIDILRKRWGFKGYVVSDCDAIGDIFRTHHYTKTYREAAALAIKAGGSINCGDTLQKHLMNAVKFKLVTEEQITHAVIQSYTGRFLLGDFDDKTKVPWHTIPASALESPKHRALALQVARQSIVLLKNENHLLPLRKQSLKSVAVIGPTAAQCHLGGYSGSPNHQISPLAGVAAYLGVQVSTNRIDGGSFTKSADGAQAQGPAVAFIKNGSWAQYKSADLTGKTSMKASVSSQHKGGTIEVHLDTLTGPLVATLHVPGTGHWSTWKTIEAPLKPTDGKHVLVLKFTGAGTDYLFNVQWFELLPESKHQTPPGKVQLLFEAGCTVTGAKDPEKFAKAVAAAKQADVAIVFAGATQAVDREGQDRAYLHLPGVQHELIQAVHAVNPRTIVVLASNCPCAVNWEQDHVPAIISALDAGQEQGTAIADVLFGKYNPGGKVSMTWFRSVKDLPDFHDYNIRHGRTYMYFKGKPLYPFGYGSSYTTFSVENLQVQSKTITPHSPARLSVEVRNTGSVAGDEVVQLYAHVKDQTVERPIQQLVGFQRVHLKPGQRKTVRFAVSHTDQALWYWDQQQNRFVQTPGDVELMVGTSAQDIHHRATVTIRA